MAAQDEAEIVTDCLGSQYSSANICKSSFFITDQVRLPVPAMKLSPACGAVVKEGELMAEDCKFNKPFLCAKREYHTILLPYFITSKLQLALGCIHQKLHSWLLRTVHMSAI